MYVLCVDPGIVNVGLVWARLDSVPNHPLKEFFWAKCVEITAIKPEDGGTHTYDKMKAFFKMYSLQFSQADKIICELQPPGSAGDKIEFMMRERFSDKLVFVAPQTLHKTFSLRGPRDLRKKNAEQIAASWLKQKGCEDAWNEVVKSEKRNHDCADAVLLLIYYLTTLCQASLPHPKKKRIRKLETCPSRPSLWSPIDKHYESNDKESLNNFSDMIEKYKYVPT